MLWVRPSIRLHLSILPYLHYKSLPLPSHCLTFHCTDVATLISATSDVLLHAARKDFTISDLANYLPTVGVQGEDRIAAWTKVWKAEQNNAHAAVIAETVWVSTMSSVHWRVDLLSGGSSTSSGSGSSSSSSSSSIDPKPVALVQLQLNNNSGNGSGSSGNKQESVLFELSAQQAKSVLEQLNKIQQRIEQRA